MVNYFLVAVSNRENLGLCLDFDMAGFPGSVNGVWAFCDVEVGDFVSFLYAAHIYNLYRVSDKMAILRAEEAPPWKPLEFRSGRVYYFPFRLLLEPVRWFRESLVRAEFAYVAENLLLRGGYAKTHFQADQTTLQCASQLGELVENYLFKSVDLKKYGVFTPKFSLDKSRVNMVDVYPLREMILQALIRKYLSQENNLARFLELMEISETQPRYLEVLGEKALPEGHVDILIKERTPIGKAKLIIIEVKSGRAYLRDLKQLEKYRAEIGSECIGACLIAKDFPRKIIKSENNIKLLKYNLDIMKNEAYTLNQLLKSLTLIKTTKLKL